MTHLTLLRDELTRRDLDGFIVPHGDEFQNEYLPPRAERLAWLTGFTGSAGTAVVLKDKAALFVDGRYTLQAQTQVSGDYIHRHLVKEPPEEWIAETLPDGARLGYDPWLHSPREVERLQKAVAKKSASLVAVTVNPIDAVWLDRPAPPHAPIVPHPIEYAGESSADKRERLAASLRKDMIDAAIVTNPASIAWLLNVRGSDVPCAPLPLSFAILRHNGCVDWFVDQAKLTALTEDGVTTRPFESFAATLSHFKTQRVLADPSLSPALVFNRLAEVGAEIVKAPDPCLLPKACKNKVELEGARMAHREDAAAIVSFLAWLEDQDVTTLTELDIIAQLEAFRRRNALYLEPSFDTIAGTGPNGAIVHYRAAPETNRTLERGSFLLLDSGGQYRAGTTDITRTLALGTPSAEMRRMFTRVLKGHIALAMARFPMGTAGQQLDVLARQFLWQDGANYDHGTGHGVGSYLSVHEGPQRISPSGEPIALKPGMILSNEPGYYKTGEYGIRIENLVAVKQAEDGFLEFETLTLVPIDRHALDPSSLNSSERDWLNAYHARVHETVSPLLDDITAKQWLTMATQML